jgi:hypothetical protein
VAQSTTTTTVIQTASSSRITSDDFRCRRSQFHCCRTVPPTGPLWHRPLRRSRSGNPRDRFPCGPADDLKIPIVEAVTRHRPSA